MSLEPPMWRTQRNTALRSLDLEWAAEQMPYGWTPSSPEVLLVSLHKARYECEDVEAPLRLESGEWLRERGYTRRDGRALAAPGELPQ